MLGLETIGAFVGASIVLALAPGPDNVFVVTSSVQRGARSGLWVTLGLCCGLIIHTMAVAVGIASLFAASPLAFTILKLVGASYLVFLAIQAWRSDAVDVRLDGKGVSSQGTNHWEMLRRGFFMNVTNPKVALFFLAFLPQFADAEKANLPLQLMSLGGLFLLVTLVIFSVIATVSGIAGTSFLRSPKAQRTLNHVSGGVFAFLAVNLALSTR